MAEIIPILLQYVYTNRPLMVLSALRGSIAMLPCSGGDESKQAAATTKSRPVFPSRMQQTFFASHNARLSLSYQI